MGDLNGDGILDLVTAGTDGSSGYATVRIGTGTGTFGAATSYQTEGAASTGLALGDFNGDGVLDILTAGVTGRSSGYATIRLGSGSGTFGAATSYATSSGSYSAKSLTVGDFNGDGNLDMGLGYSVGPLGFEVGYVQIGLGDGRGALGAFSSIATANKDLFGMSFADVTGDGVLDIIAAGGSSSGAGQVSVMKGLTRDGISPLLSFSLKTKADALQSMGMLDRTLGNLSKQRGVIGSFQSRIGVALNTLQSSREAYSAAESRIRDVDVAETTSRLVRTQILQTAATSILAQANQLPQLALQLLR